MSMSTPPPSRNILPKPEATRLDNPVVDVASPRDEATEDAATFDHVPEEILQILQQPFHADSVSSKTRLRPLAARGRPDSVWNYPERREKFRHLTDRPPCTCGVGRDVSFLYDSRHLTKEETSGRTPGEERRDPSRDRTVGTGGRAFVVDGSFDESESKDDVPSSIVPGEYHVVKSRGILGLDYIEDRYSTQPSKHEAHLTQFPSLRPSGRKEVRQLRKVMDDLLQKAGVDEVEAEETGPTQMHNILEIMRKEQTVYNLVFHELIRQTTVDCAERGELLARLRDRYNRMLSRIPRQISSLYEEVLAQRALDRRLTEELTQFKTTIAKLTEELNFLKEHDAFVSRQSKAAQEELKAALAEAKKNANLLEEYHGLYELQRHRLEGQIAGLMAEKELWSGAAYNLALKVMEEKNLITTKRLHVAEKSWSKLALHFAILLSDKDTDELAQLQLIVEQWRDNMEAFNKEVCQKERETVDNMDKILFAVRQWTNDFVGVVVNDRARFVRSPEPGFIQRLTADMSAWIELLNGEAEKIGGELLLTRTENLRILNGLVDQWTECSVRIFNRHRKGEKEHPMREKMREMNDEIREMLAQYRVRITGENGVAHCVVSLLNLVENWEQRLQGFLSGGAIPDAQWSRLFGLMGEWASLLEDAKQGVGSTQKAEERLVDKPANFIDVVKMFGRVHKWMTMSSTAVDSEDARVTEEATELHTDMVRWMVRMLVRLAPDHPSASEAAAVVALHGIRTPYELSNDATNLCQRLKTFSRQIIDCCVDVVQEIRQNKAALGDPDAEHEVVDLQKVSQECDEWVLVAKLLLGEMQAFEAQRVGVLPQQQTNASAKQMERVLDAAAAAAEAAAAEAAADDEDKEDEEEGEEKKSTDPGKEEKKEMEEETPKGDELQFIGFDQNTHKKPLPRDDEAPPPESVVEEGANPEEAPDMRRAFEALASVGILKKQLMSTERRAQEAEARVTRLEEQLKRCREELRQAERGSAGNLAGDGGLPDNTIDEEVDEGDEPGSVASGRGKSLLSSPEKSPVKGASPRGRMRSTSRGKERGSSESPSSRSSSGGVLSGASKASEAYKSSKESNGASGAPTAASKIKKKPTVQKKK